MKTLLLLYNKVTNEAFSKLRINNTKFADISLYGKNMDILSSLQVGSFLTNMLPFDNILIGDVFWTTGQNICSWCVKKDKKCVFLQHGQWIYTANKKNPPYLPRITCVYGDNLADVINGWLYGQRSKITATGSPKYDLCQQSSDGNGISKPIIKI